MRILHWFRKDLRLDDNTALDAARRDAAGDVVPFYVSEPSWLARDDVAATRVRYALDALADLARAIEHAGSHLALDHAEAVDAVPRAARAAGADAVYWNDEYEPALVVRDAAVERALVAADIRVRRFADRLLVAPGAVRNASGAPYVVYSAFANACAARPVEAPRPRTTRFAAHTLPRRRLATLERLGFETRQTPWPGGETHARRRLERFCASRLAAYATARDVPALDGGSRLSADFKFGTLSPRAVVAAVRAAAGRDAGRRAAADKYVSELRWRDFYAHVMFHFPHAERGAFRRAFDALAWSGDPAHFDAWERGVTGFPIVDAAQRELLGSGFMHNRGRMIVASFLTKDLLLDWRLGERHFMRHLVDGDVANNNGGWQWAASTGTDAQPWFRVFNPVLQGRRFDGDGAYVKRWVPELARVPEKWIHSPWEAPPLVLAEAGVRLGSTYPRPIVDHATQRELALGMYGAIGSHPLA